MASWMIHLRIADQLIDLIPDLDETAFVIGNIAPDSGVPNADWTAYSPPKSVSHFKTKKEDETFFDLNCFISEYFSPPKIRSFSRREFSFFLGYYVHLLADVEWTMKIYRPAITEYADRLGKEKTSFIWEMKRDWYDLDFRYLAEHPEFRAFSLYEQAAGYRNDLMDIFSADAFDNRREYICGYYRGEHGELTRNYPYLTPEQADAFVAEAARKILPKLDTALSVWHESVPFRLTALQPSQFFISAKKLRDIQAWFNPFDLSGFSAIPVKMLDGVPVMTDGHTRAVAAIRAGLDAVPLVWDRDELDWDMYRRCVTECRRRQVTSPEDLTRRVIPEDEYREKWDRWCDAMQAEVEKSRRMNP